jgi:hypothetical protein
MCRVFNFALAYDVLPVSMMFSVSFTDEKSLLVLISTFAGVMTCHNHVQ